MANERSRNQPEPAEPEPAEPVAPWVAAFPAEPTVTAGTVLRLHVAGSGARARVHGRRLGGDDDVVLRTDWLPLAARAPHRPADDWSQADPGWPGHDVPVPADLRSGAYGLTVEASDGAAPAQVLVVVRNPHSTARVLAKLPLFTYHAYNLGPRSGPGAWCLYTLPDDEPCRAVSWRRPGGGLGGVPWDLHNHDPFDPSPRQTVDHWDVPMLRFLDGLGVDVDVCTDLDLHRDRHVLDRYRLLVSAGHDEYWSDGMRDAVEGFVAGGGNAAFFGGNTSWWRIEVDDAAHRFRRVGRWCDVAGREEVRLLGAGFANGGERDRDDFPTPVGYRVQHADHWVHAGTGLRDGDCFGDAPDEYLVGYECDGAHVDRATLTAGTPVRPSGEDGAPDDVVILGLGDLEPSGWGTGSRVATMVVRDGRDGRGSLFNAATTDWPRLLHHRGPGGEVVRRITANVVERFSS